eukprot:3763274-Heterocapsa_arctica.AAC.1
MVEPSLALVHGPLQRSGEDPQVVVALQAVAVRQDVDDKLCGGDPEAAIGHGRQTNGDSTGTPLEIIQSLSPFLRRLAFIDVLGSLWNGGRLLLLLLLLQLKAVNAARHGHEERRE